VAAEIYIVVGPEAPVAVVDMEAVGMAQLEHMAKDFLAVAVMLEPVIPAAAAVENLKMDIMLRLMERVVMAAAVK
jgi:hypothetical protein